MRKNYKEPKMKPLDLKGEVILAGSPRPTLEGYGDEFYREIDED